MNINAQLHQAIQYFQARRFAEVEQICLQILQLAPQNDAALRLLGGAQLSTGRLQEAEANIRKAISINPSVPEYYDNLSVVLFNRKQNQDAEQMARKALALAPQFAQAQNNLGKALRAQGKPRAAIAAYQRALAINPNYVQAEVNLADALQVMGRAVEAEQACRHALALQPQFAEAENNLGNALQGQGRYDEAVLAYQRALALKPQLSQAEYNLAISLKSLGQLEASVKAYERALALSPNYAQASNNMGSVLKTQGRLDEADAAFERALELNPNYAIAYTNLLANALCRPNVGLAELAELHREYDRRFAATYADWFSTQPELKQSEPAQQADSPAGSRRLRIGFVSPDFGTHPVGYFLIRVFEHLDADQFETFCYSDRSESMKDVFTKRFAQAADHWRDTRLLSDDNLARQIRVDAVDVLIDLTGHTGGHRLLVFARKPAPIQMSWIGHPGTTGLSAIDYLIADAYLIPTAAEPFYCEQVIRLPDAYMCYEPPESAPPVGPLPATSAGYVTFASFNKLDKTTPEVVAAWSQILQRVPTARLVMKYSGLDDPATRDRFAGMFAKHGIDAERITYLGWSSRAEMFDEYNRVDIALDTFPFTGGATTCEALWMGVPVVTFPGETFAGRQTYSYLSNIGITDSIADDRDNYIETAVRLADDLPLLADIRQRLRKQMAASPFCDGARFAKNFGEVLRKVAGR